MTEMQSDDPFLNQTNSTKIEKMNGVRTKIHFLHNVFCPVCLNAYNL